MNWFDLGNISVSNTKWDSPWMLLALIVPIALVFVGRSQRAPISSMSLRGSHESIGRTVRQRLMWLPRALLVLGLACLVLALARPQVGEGKVLTSTDAVAIQLVVDRSGSMSLPMEMDGTELSRLDVVKRVLHDFLLGDGKSLKGRPSDLIGLVTFARFADTSCPLVRDHQALEQLTQAIPLARRGLDDGTAIGDGLALAAARLRTAEQDLKLRHSELSNEDFRIKSKVIVLLTDGDNNAGERDPLEAAKLASEWGIRVHTIGIGGNSYQTMRTPFGEQRIPVASDVDERTLKKISELTGGKYFRAGDGQSLRSIYKEIDDMEKSNVKTVDYTDYRELFAPIGAFALGLVTMSCVLSWTLFRRNA